ncbi:hypothetical protein CBM2617_U10021 [Cupriavidus taiwanensis]|nr:hypothetical protein CBM2617_U10021 [Cupriavidus taiwanensis]
MPSPAGGARPPSAARCRWVLTVLYLEAARVRADGHYHGRLLLQARCLGHRALEAGGPRQ